MHGVRLVQGVGYVLLCVSDWLFVSWWLQMRWKWKKKRQRRLQRKRRKMRARSK